MESLDRTFENVCELDLVFYFDEVCITLTGILALLMFIQVHHILSEIIQGGLVLETNVEEIDDSGVQLCSLKTIQPSGLRVLRTSASSSLTNDAQYNKLLNYGKNLMLLQIHYLWALAVD